MVGDKDSPMLKLRLSIGLNKEYLRLFKSTYLRMDIEIHRLKYYEINLILKKIIIEILLLKSKVFYLKENKT
jgi:hypothetical protein